MAAHPFGPTVTIDDARNGGSDDGAWATAIAHTPHLARQCAADFLETYETPASSRSDAGDDDRSNVND